MLSRYDAPETLTAADRRARIAASLGSPASLESPRSKGHVRPTRGSVSSPLSGSGLRRKSPLQDSERSGLLAKSTIDHARERPKKDRNLDAVSVANRLASFLWSGPPDEELMGVAADGAPKHKRTVSDYRRRISWSNTWATHGQHRAAPK